MGNTQMTDNQTTLRYEDLISGRLYKQEKVKPIIHKRKQSRNFCKPVHEWLERVDTLGNEIEEVWNVSADDNQNYAEPVRLKKNNQNIDVLERYGFNDFYYCDQWQTGENFKMGFDYKWALIPEHMRIILMD